MFSDGGDYMKVSFNHFANTRQTEKVSKLKDENLKVVVKSVNTATKSSSQSAKED